MSLPPIYTEAVFALAAVALGGYFTKSTGFREHCMTPLRKRRSGATCISYKTPLHTLAYLDQYEGINDNPAPFIRRVIPVSMGSQTLNCQVYLYNGSTDNLRLISSGRFRGL